MGRSFLGYGQQSIALEDDTLALICRIMVKHHSELPIDSKESAALKPLIAKIVSNSYFGFNACLDIKDVFPSVAGVQPLVPFIERIVLDLTQLGGSLSTGFIQNLPGDSVVDRTRWFTSELIDVLERLAEILATEISQ